MKSKSVFAALALGIAVLCSCRTDSKAPVDVSHYPSNSQLPGRGPTNIWSGLPRVWEERHRQWAGHEQADHGGVVFLGDSITQLWNSLQNDFPHLKTVNRGIGGDTTRGVLYRLDPDVLDLDPEAVVLLIGTNDVGNDADPDDIIANIKAIIARLKRHHPHAPIVLCKVMPRHDRATDYREKIKRLNEGIEQIAKGDKRLTLCDTWTPFADAQGYCSKDEFPDMLHPNAIGYAKWKAALEPIFARLQLTSRRE